MKSFNKEFAKQAEKTRLTASERRALRDRILMYMEYHPLPKSARSLSEEVSKQSFFSLNSIAVRIAAGAFAFVFVIVTVPLAAEQAMPGDVLYPIKTSINESVRAQFIDSPYEKVVFETELMERRISEARLLAKEGNLSEAEEAQIAETVKDQADAVQRSIADLAVNDADGGAIAAITFGSALEVQSALFENTSSETDGIALAVRSAKETAVAQTATTTASYEGLLGGVEQSTTRAHELFASVEEFATNDEERNIERRLADLERQVAKAERVHGDGEEEEAVTLLATTLSDIQKLISFMTDIDVRENVQLEALVPVVLTPEERLQNIEAAFEDIQSEWEPVALPEDEIATTTDTIETPVIVETILLEMPTLIDAAHSALDAGDVEAAEDVIEDAEVLLAEFEVIDPKSEPTTEETNNAEGASVLE